MIRLASEKEALEIMQQPINQKGIGCKPTYLKFQPWLCVQGDAYLVFVFWEVGNYIYEVHICTSDHSRKNARDLAKEVITWLFKNGAKKVITSATTKSIGNMALKVGMNYMGFMDNKYYYEVSKWQSGQQ